MDELRKQELIKIHTAELEGLRKLVREAKQDVGNARAFAEQYKVEAEKQKIEFKQVIANSKYVEINGVKTNFSEYLKHVRIQAAAQSAYLELPWWRKLFVAEPQWK